MPFWAHAIAIGDAPRFSDNMQQPHLQLADLFLDAHVRALLKWNSPGPLCSPSKYSYSLSPPSDPVRWSWEVPRPPHLLPSPALSPNPVAGPPLRDLPKVPLRPPGLRCSLLPLQGLQGSWLHARPPRPLQS